MQSISAYNYNIVNAPIFVPPTQSKNASSSQRTLGLQASVTATNSSRNSSGSPTYASHNQSGNATISRGSQYVVRPGDSFWAIATSQMGRGMNMYDLAAANGMTINSTIYPGMRLRIPT